MVSLNEAAADMGRYLIKASLLLAVAACGASRAGVSAAERPFTVSEVTSFDSPWAMSFLPGSGVPMTKMALVTEKGGRLWLVDTASGRKEEVAGVPKVHVEGRAGCSMC